MMSNIREFLITLPSFQNQSQQSKKNVQRLIHEFNESISNELDILSEQSYRQQFKKLFETLNSPVKLSILNDIDHRALIIGFIKREGIQYYKYSYYNRAKITKTHIKKLQQVGPILFSEAVMISSKINIINKNNSRFFIQDHLYSESQSPVDMRIQQILKLCDQKKRNLNNNFKKLQLILEGPDSMQVIKQLGKMLRDSWKKDKSKTKCNDIVPSNKYEQQLLNAKNKIIQDNLQNDSQENISVDLFRNRQVDGLSFASSQKQLLKQALYAKHPQHQYRYYSPQQQFSSERSQIFSRFESPQFI